MYVHTTDITCMYMYMCSDMTDLPVLSTYRELDPRVPRVKLAPFTVLILTVKGAVTKEFVSVVRLGRCSFV